ncbi:MAG TPA: hypothetical protein VI485_13075 [Vicinamibacterales bacterium]|nr:hypothetical protein [Vicinamibacterales bacterium]
MLTIRSTPRRTPDYELLLDGVRVIVEVKEIEKSEEEIESDRLVQLRGYGNVISMTPGERLRKKITTSRRSREHTSRSF